MPVVRGGDHHHADIWVIDHRLGARDSLLELVPFRCPPRGYAAGRGYGHETLEAGILEGGQQRPGGKGACADPADSGLATASRAGPQPYRLVRACRGRVGEADRQVWLGPFFQEPVRGVRLADIEGLGDQVGHLESARGEQVEHGFLVPAFGPAHLPGRVVDAPLLIRRLIAARPVGAGEQHEISRL